jgi:hypothetical protein
MPTFLEPKISLFISMKIRIVWVVEYIVIDVKNAKDGVDCRSP